MEPDWLVWARKLQAVAQTGLTFGRDQFDIERYEIIRDIAAEMMARNSEADLEYLNGLFAAETGYATPTIDVRGAVFRGNEVLMVRERRDGLWTLPGGFADVNTSPREAVEREIEEESGYRARATKLAAVYDKRLHGHPPSPRHTYKLFFTCDLFGGNARTSNETDEIGFFPQNELPDLSPPRITAEEIDMVFRHHHNPDLPAEFD